jgi:NADPH2:quinone reductase
LKAIQVTEFGGPEVLVLRDLPDPEPAEGLVVLDVTAAGINWADTHQAENSYLAPSQLPMIPGGEVVGTTPDGERMLALVQGGYCEKAVAAPSMMFPIPEGVDDAQALALVVQGTTAWHLLRTCTHMAQGESVVVHAGAGGVGTLAIQLAKLWGAGRVIATASSEEKRQMTLDLGADAAIDGNADDLKQAIEDANGGEKVDVVLEMVGGNPFDQSLAALAPFGRLAFYGMAGRKPPTPIEPGSLLQKSRAVIGFWLIHSLGRPGMLSEPLKELFDMVAGGELKPVMGGTYPLADARKAHEDMRARRTHGKLVIDPRA